MAQRFLSNIRINDAYTLPASDGTEGQVISTDGTGNLSFVDIASGGAPVMYKDDFAGDGIETVFQLANPVGSVIQTQLYIDGVYQEKETYSVDGTNITFTTAPPSGTSIEVISITGINFAGDFTVDSLQFTGGTGTQGTLSWNADEETLDLVQNGATLQLGQEIQVHVKNQTGSTIPDATPVYVTGTLGTSGRLTVAPMIADGSIPAKFFLGVTTESIANGEDGKVTTFGKVRGLDTSIYTEGQTLFVSASTAGAFQTTPPVSPNLDLEVAIVVNSDANNGTLFVRAQNGYYLGMLHDVALAGLADKDLLVYNNTTGVWENSKTLGDVTTGNITTSGTVDGVDISSFKSQFDTHLHDDRYYTETEIGQFFGGSVAITGYNKSNWDTAYGWGDHSLVGYLTTETDPVFSASAAAGIASTDITNWNTAYGWGDHAAAGYLTSYTETDTLQSVTSRGSISTNDIVIQGANLFLDKSGVNGDTNRIIRFTESKDNAQFQGAYIFYNGESNLFQIGTHDAVDSNTASDVYAIQMTRGTGNVEVNNNITAAAFVKRNGTSSQFLKADGSVDSNTYLTSYTETDTLDSVTDKGATTTNPITIGGATVNGLISLPQNPVGTTYGNGVATVPSYMFQQGAGDNDGIRLYAEAGVTNDVRFIFEVVDDIETGDTWVFRNKKTYGDFAASEVVKISGAGDITASGTLSASGYNNSNWDTAYGWGNHAGLYVPLSRTITINGTTLDLSADRVFEVSGGGGSEEFDSIDIQTDTSINPSKNIINFTNLDTLVDSGQIIGGITFSSSDTRDTTGVLAGIKAYQQVIEYEDPFAFPPGSGEIEYYIGSDLRFYTSDQYYKNKERARFLGDSGDLIIGKTDPYQNDCVILSQFGIMYSRRSSSSNALHISFVNGGSERGRIQSSTSSTSYLTSSDYRLKENVVPLTGSLDRVLLLKPSRFNFKSDPDKMVDGFLAHEVQDIVPEAISGEKDAIDHNGNPEYQAIDQSKLVPLLVGAIQELKAEVEALKQQLNGTN